MTRRRRDLAIDQPNVFPGIECVKPSGAFYLFPRYASLLGK
jgi:aspartate/methionine/tyrosine aminotransferase